MRGFSGSLGEGDMCLFVDIDVGDENVWTELVMQGFLPFWHLGDLRGRRLVGWLNDWFVDLVG